MELVGIEGTSGKLLVLHAYIPLIVLYTYNSYPFLRFNSLNESLEYYTNKSSTSYTKSVKLCNLKCIRKFDNLSFQIDAGIDGMYMLRVQSQAEYSCWTKALEEYIQQKRVCYVYT